MVPLALFDIFELFLISFKPLGGWNTRDGILGASLGLLDVGIDLFKISNSSMLSVEGMKPRNTCYVIGIEVTHMLGDGRVGVHLVKWDFVFPWPCIVALFC